MKIKKNENEIIKLFLYFIIKKLFHYVSDKKTNAEVEKLMLSNTVYVAISVFLLHWRVAESYRNRRREGGGW